MSRTRYVCIIALVTLVVTGCQSPPSPRTAPEQVLSVGCASGGPLPLDRGDWAVSQRTQVWKVMADQPDRPPVHVGYVTGRRYRQMRGGPEYTILAVSTLNRREEVGRIDQLGRAWRYEPRRNTGFEEVDLGVSTQENSVAAILGLKQRVLLEETSERRIAFDLLDRDGSGALEAAEVETRGDRLQAADTNRDQKVDFQEFDALDTL